MKENKEIIQTRIIRKQREWRTALAGHAFVCAMVTTSALCIRTSQAQVSFPQQQSTLQKVVQHTASTNDDAQSAQITFTDVTAQAGITFVNHGSGSNHAGVAAVDLTGDGYPELFFQDDGIAGNNQLYLNNADGTLADVGAALGFAPAGNARGIISLDYDLDGDLDIIIANTNGPAQLYRNDGGNNSIIDELDYAIYLAAFIADRI